MLLPRPPAAIWSATCCNASARRPSSATAQPPAASWRAISAPIPELAPTTMAWRKTRLMRASPSRAAHRERVGAGSSGSSSGWRSDPHAVPQQAARDHQPLDLRRALVDLHHARVAEVALDRVLLHVAVAAVDLDRLMRHPSGGFGGIELGDARGADEVAAHVLEPRGLPDEQPGRLDPALHLRELELDRLELRDGLAPGPPLLRVAHGLVERGGHHTQRLRGHADPARVEAL